MNCQVSDKKSGDKSIKIFFISALVLFAAAFALLIAARRISGFADMYTNMVYPVLVGTVGRFFGLFPFSVVEIGLYALTVALIALALRYIIKKKPLKLISIYVFIAGLLLFLYSAGCGVNYYREPFSTYYMEHLREIRGDDLILTAGESDLEDMLEWLTGKVNEARKEFDASSGNYERLAAKGVAAMEKAAGTYPELSGYYPRPKPVLISEILSLGQYTGVYSPFTIEANYNRAMVSYNMPHTICHELSHLRGFMREDEANFIGYLACTGSDDADMRYSGYLLGWIYAGNALAKSDPEGYERLRGELSGSVEEDIEENNAYWERFEGKPAEAAEKMNDTYLKANGQSEGVKTYGRVVDLMLIDYLNRE